jgi:hypothetical protein
MLLNNLLLCRWISLKQDKAPKFVPSPTYVAAQFFEMGEVGEQGNLCGNRALAVVTKKEGDWYTISDEKHLFRENPMKTVKHPQ